MGQENLSCSGTLATQGNRITDDDCVFTPSEGVKRKSCHHIRPNKNEYTEYTNIASKSVIDIFITFYSMHKAIYIHVMPL